MKNNKMDDLYQFIGFFNDGLFMNQDYRRGILDTITYIRNQGGRLGSLLCKVGFIEDTKANKKGTKDE